MSPNPEPRVLSRLRGYSLWNRKARLLLGQPTAGDHSITWHITTEVGEVDLVARLSGSNLRLECASEDALVARSLRAMLVTKAALVAEPEEHHVLTDISAASRGAARELMRHAMYWAEAVTSMAHREQEIHRGSTSLQNVVAQGIWYDRRPNFGDAVGPWLVTALTGKDVVNVRRTRETPTKARGRATLLVGSIIQMINRNNVDIWGSGLMRALSVEQVTAFSRLKNIRVRAVRGRLTAAELREKLGWEVPEIYGDPALLLPRHFPVTSRGEHIAVVPHLKHRAAMRELANDRLVVSDVREDLETVVAQIASAQACISTSLHGIIVAQAYGVPWVWLNLTDSPVDGRDFKFDDFFTTIDAAAVSRLDVPLSEVTRLDFIELAQQTTLPDLRTDLDRLEAALPVRRATSGAVGTEASQRGLSSVPARLARGIRRLRSRSDRRIRSH